MLFDSHAHYNDERFKDDVDEVLSAMNENNVGLILNSCSSLDEVPDIFAICEKYHYSRSHFKRYGYLFNCCRVFGCAERS